MFMLAIQNHQSLEIIDQKFLVPGHTHLECDTIDYKYYRLLTERFFGSLQ
jgi:hypothetical protein